MKPDRDRMRSKAERGADLFESHPAAVRALLSVEKLPKRIWEPAAGKGVISNVLLDAELEVLSTDLYDHGANDLVDAGIDFLTVDETPKGIECVVTNPPYGLDDEFVRHALTLAPRSYFLMRMGYLAGLRWTEGKLARHLMRAWIFSPRLPPMHQDQWVGKMVETATRDFAWLVFNAQRSHPDTRPEIGWLNWRTHATAAELIDEKKRLDAVRRHNARLSERVEV